MEKRKIVVIDSATNRKVEVMTDATTLGELKRDLRPAGINFENKDWLEGFSQTSPVNDDSQLPTSVTYQGRTTNNLVYMLTNTNKAIKNGCMTRKEAYAYLAEHESLKEEVKEKYGKNYTQVKTEDLSKVITAHINSNIKEAYNKAKVECECAIEEKEESESNSEFVQIDVDNLKYDEVVSILDAIHHGLLAVQTWLEKSTLAEKPVELSLSDEEYKKIFS